MSRIQAWAARNLRLEQQVQAADLLQCCRYEKLSCWQLRLPWACWGKDHAGSIPDGKAACETCHAVWNWVANVLVAVVSTHVASPWNRSVKNELENVQKKAGMEAISYTTWDDTFGEGTQTGRHFPTHTWNDEVMRFWGHEEAPWVPQLVCYKWGIKRGAKPFCVCISWILKGVLLGSLDQTVNLRHSQICPLWCGESMWIKHNQTSKFKGCETCSKVENGDCSCCTFP